LKRFGERGRNRTFNLLIKSQLLPTFPECYQLRQVPANTVDSENQPYEFVQHTSAIRQFA
jgi:hypothetical protein